MKKIRCPKCDETIIFDEKRFEGGRTLVFECPSCKKQFKIRMPSKNEPSEQAEEEKEVVGELVVLENSFQLKQVLPLYEGLNTIGRKVKGTDLTSPILTVDPSIDSFHCKINVIRNKQGNYVFSLSDAPSNTGTFLNNKILGDTEKANVAHGDIINLGASTIILKEKGKEDEE